MDKKALKDSFAEILMAKYIDHAEDLRHRLKTDLNFLTGYLTIGLVVSGFFYKNPIRLCIHKIAFSVLVSALTLFIILLIMRNAKQRKTVISILHNINDALRFGEKEIYGSGLINPQDYRNYKLWTPLYYFIIIITYVAQIIVLWSAI